ncbi:hypothetical protein Bca52824_028074 [Brassica carinata]|uniref:ENT domain-containing protein n=1 Tax=Brassica carinata TaxID=52824 RepID=A0A8X7VBM0_BRACI|nr:hypothetical protein Bca52824_028074 [Brassica carinata]
MPLTCTEKAIMRFRKGSRVEVLSLKEASYGAWRTAEILSGNGHTYSVRYYSFGIAKDEVLEERVARKMIRPCPPLIDVDRWQSGELVEVLDHIFWKPATVLEELSGRYYVVRLLGVSGELTVHKVNLRARHAWQDGRWVMIEKVSCSVKSSTLTGSDVNQKLKPHETRVVSIRLLKRPSPCESAESCTGSPKKMRSMKEGANRPMVRVRSKRFSDISDDACSVGSCSPIRYDESTSFLDGSSSQDADSYTSDAESSKGCREDSLAGDGEVGSSLSRPELSTYRVTLGKLFAQGPLNWDQEASLTDLRLSLNISTDEHLMEIRNLTSAGAGHTFPAMWNQLLHIFLFQEGSYSVICIDNRMEECMNSVAVPGACRSCLLASRDLTLMHWVYRIVQNTTPLFPPIHELIVLCFAFWLFITDLLQVFVGSTLFTGTGYVPVLRRTFTVWLDKFGDDRGKCTYKGRRSTDPF